MRAQFSFRYNIHEGTILLRILERRVQYWIFRSALMYERLNITKMLQHNTVILTKAQEAIIAERDSVLESHRTDYCCTLLMNGIMDFLQTSYLP